jgi:release factor glutamine methyltransferase
VNLLVTVALRQATQRLADANCDSPALDARLLLAEATGMSPEALLASARQPLGDVELVRFYALLDRRAAGEPVARILGRREFWSLDLLVSADTLVPRPETETVVEAALRRLRQAPAGPLRILDLGTGSGAILLALLSELPNALGVALDRSAGALATARENARRLGLAQRTLFLCGDFADAISGQFDAVVSNPPYIAGAEIAGLPVEVREHDPTLALDGGTEGLDAYRRIVAALPLLLRPAGFAVLELGAGQEEPVAALAEAAGLRPVRPAARDLAGIGRALVIEPVA